MDITNFARNIKEQVAQNRLDLALNELRELLQTQDYYNEAVLQSSRYADIERQIQRNTVSKTEADVEKNKIRLAILKIVDDVQKQVIQSALQGLEKGARDSISIREEGEMILQDANGGTLTLNYREADQLRMLFKHLSSHQSIQLKRMLAARDKAMLSEIRKAQEDADEQNTDGKIKSYAAEVDAFFRELKIARMEAVKKRILRAYSMLHEYEDLLVLEVDPKRKELYKLQIENIQANINKEEQEMAGIAKQG
jgi:hypothetical protein